MNRFFAPHLIHICFDIGLDLPCLSVRIPGKLILASALFAKRLFLHVQLSQNCVDVRLGSLIQPMCYL